MAAPLSLNRSFDVLHLLGALVATVGVLLLGKLRFVGGCSKLLWQSFCECWQKPYYPRLIVEQMFNVGWRTLPLVAAAALSTGLVMTLQFGAGLEKFGAKLYVPNILALSIAKELGPVFTGLMFSARVGSGIASEISSMVVTQQIDAIRALGTSPLKRVVLPRVVSCLVALPLLTILVNVIAIVGAVWVGSVELGLDAGFFAQKVLSTVTVSDYIGGLIKTVFFALFVVFSACYYGLRVKEGTRGVGLATTQSVVASSVLIVIGDFFLSKILLGFHL